MLECWNAAYRLRYSSSSSCEVVGVFDEEEENTRAGVSDSADVEGAASSAGPEAEAKVPLLAEYSTDDMVGGRQRDCWNALSGWQVLADLRSVSCRASEGS